MGIIRLLLLIAVVWLVWRLFRQAFLQSPPDQTPGANGTTRMIRCERCGVHVPESEAFMARGHYFCSHDHQAAWLEDNS